MLRGRWLFRSVVALAPLTVSVLAAVLNPVLPASSAGVAATGRQTSPVRQGPFAVVIVVDAGRYDEFDLSHMPNLAKLAASGTSYANAWVGQLPSITETSHATIGTGVLPRRHLILGDTWRIPGTNQMSPDLLDANLDRTGYIGKLIRQSGSPSMASIVQQRWPGSRVAALSAHKIYAADAMGAGAADFVAYGIRDARNHFVPGGIPGHEPDAAVLKAPWLDLPAFPRQAGVEDNWTASLALKFISHYHPRLLMINLPEVDGIGHVQGTSATVMSPVLANVDHEIGRLVAAYGRAHLGSQTYFIVTADHGMIPATHIVTQDQIKKTIKKAGGQPLYVGHGDYSPIWLKNPDAIPRVASALAAANIANVDAIYQKDPNGKYRLVSPASRLAVPGAAKAYQDLLGTLNQGESPDIVLLYDENTITMTPQFRQIGRKGDHGGATWGSQHIPLFISGPGIRAGFVSQYPARLVDIAPTVETLLQATPQGQDGVPLADAMINAPPAAIAAQANRAKQMTADVTSLELEAQTRPNLKH